MPGSPLSAPPEVRFRWYRQVEVCHKTIPEVCEIFGISKKTYHKWYNRDHGFMSNRYRPRRAHPHTKLTPRIRLAVYEAKISYNYGPAKMKLHIKRNFGLDISTTAIYKYFRKRRLIRKPQRRQPWYMPMKEPFYANQPGENVQFDVKYVPGENRTWNYQFRLTDSFSNMQYAIDSLDKSSEAAIDAFRGAKRYFPFPITGIQTDNGGEFRGAFAFYLKTLGVTHRFIPKRSAPWNGKVERANRSVDDEYYLNENKPWKNIAQYIRWYNHERYHLGKGMDGLTPYEKFQQYLLTACEQSPLKVN